MQDEERSDSCFLFEGIPTAVSGVAVTSDPASSLAVGLDLEVSISCRRAVLVGLSLYAVFLVLPSRDFEVFRRAI